MSWQEKIERYRGEEQREREQLKLKIVKEKIPPLLEVLEKCRAKEFLTQIRDEVWKLGEVIVSPNIETLTPETPIEAEVKLIAKWPWYHEAHSFQIQRDREGLYITTEWCAGGIAIHHELLLIRADYIRDEELHPMEENGERGMIYLRCNPQGNFLPSGLDCGASYYIKVSQQEIPAHIYHSDIRREIFLDKRYLPSTQRQIYGKLMREHPETAEFQDAYLRCEREIQANLRDFQNRIWLEKVKDEDLVASLEDFLIRDCLIRKEKELSDDDLRGQPPPFDRCRATAEPRVIQAIIKAGLIPPKGFEYLLDLAEKVRLEANRSQTE